MEKLLIIIAIMAIAGAARAGEVYECPDPGTCLLVDKDHPPLHMRPKKEKSCRWEVFPISQGPDFTSKLPEAAEVITVVQDQFNSATIWLKRRVCE